MADMEKVVDPGSESMQQFERAVEVGLKVAAPWKKLAVWLIIALIATNSFWLIRDLYETKKAYENPVEMEQVQDFPEEKQEQKYKG